MQIKPETIIKTFDKSETHKIKERWKKAFCKEGQGIGLNQYLWHIFCWERYPSVEGPDAEREYSAHLAKSYIVMPNDNDRAVLVNIKPEGLNYADVYVFPENYAWTMAFTHEEGWMGPYFAQHKNYKALEKENVQYREKLRQIEYAKKKGWV